MGAADSTGTEGATNDAVGVDVGAKLNVMVPALPIPVTREDSSAVPFSIPAASAALAASLGAFTRGPG